MKQPDLTKPDAMKLGSRALKSNPNPETLKFSRKNPYPAELLERIKLNGEGSAKETIHLEFKLEESALTYEAGDSLAVLAHNADDVVKDIITLTGLS